MRANSINPEVSCKLTSSELQQRKATVIARLKAVLMEKKELANGFSFRFDGSDATLGLLIDFIKSERACCSFFTFKLTVNGNGDETLLQLSGPAGTKEMIVTELGL